MDKTSALTVLKGLDGSLENTRLVGGLDKQSLALAAKTYRAILAAAEKEKWLEDMDALNLLPAFEDGILPTSDELSLALGMLRALLRAA